MQEAPYSNRELEAMFKVITDKMSEQHDDSVDYLKRIEAQTVKTNGRVTSLENKEIAARTKTNTGLGLIILIIIPLVVYIFITATQCSNGQCATTTNTTINQ